MSTSHPSPASWGCFPVLTPPKAPHNQTLRTTGQGCKVPLPPLPVHPPRTPVSSSRFLPAYFSMLGRMLLYSLMNAEGGGSSSRLGWTVKYRNGTEDRVNSHSPRLSSSHPLPKSVRNACGLNRATNSSTLSFFSESPAGTCFICHTANRWSLFFIYLFLFYGALVSCLHVCLSLE